MEKTVVKCFLTKKSAQKAKSGDDKLCVFVESLVKGSLFENGKLRDHVNFTPEKFADKAKFQALYAKAAGLKSGEVFNFGLSGVTNEYEPGKDGLKAANAWWD